MIGECIVGHIEPLDAGSNEAWMKQQNKGTALESILAGRYDLKEDFP